MKKRLNPIQSAELFARALSDAHHVSIRTRGIYKTSEDYRPCLNAETGDGHFKYNLEDAKELITRFVKEYFGEASPVVTTKNRNPIFPTISIENISANTAKEIASVGMPGVCRDSNTVTLPVEKLPLLQNVPLS